MRVHYLATASLALMFCTPTTTAHESPAPTPVSLTWLVGDWCGMQGQDGLQESWRLHGDLLLGMAGTVRDGKLRSFEYTRIGTGKEGLEFIAQPGGVPPTSFALTSHGPQRVDFANTAHDFPQRVSYWREGEKLRAEIAGPGEKGEMRIAFEYVACPKS